MSRGWLNFYWTESETLPDEELVHYTGRPRKTGFLQQPGNVRELAHELERAVVLSDSEHLDIPNLAPPPILHLELPCRYRDDGLTKPGVPRGWRFGHGRRYCPYHPEGAGASQWQCFQGFPALGVPRDFIRYRLKKQGI